LNIEVVVFALIRTMNKHVLFVKRPRATKKQWKCPKPEPRENCSERPGLWIVLNIEEKGRFSKREKPCNGWTWHSTAWYHRRLSFVMKIEEAKNNKMRNSHISG